MFLTFGFILMYSVLNKLSEYMYFSILKKNITLHTFVTWFKIAETFQHIVNQKLETFTRKPQFAFYVWMNQFGQFHWSMQFFCPLNLNNH